MGRRLYVGNLPYKATDEDLMSLFSRAGAVDNVRVMRDQATGRARGFAFVEMVNDEDAQKAIQEFHQFQYRRASARRERGATRRNRAASAAEGAAAVAATVAAVAAADAGSRAGRVQRHAFEVQRGGAVAASHDEASAALAFQGNARTSEPRAQNLRT